MKFLLIRQSPIVRALRPYPSNIPSFPNSSPPPPPRRHHRAASPPPSWSVCLLLAPPPLYGGQVVLVASPLRDPGGDRRFRAIHLGRTPWAYISAVASGPGPDAYPSPSLDSAAAVKDIAAAISSFIRGRHVGRPLGPPVTRTQP
ncbi:hypothetical protein GUJ93_ZPchr0012g21293 [Zizania palustris]|uniref:Uncharacterized protein n=1 Tax=Zizania palustris TaxID=103762 RepID=A0A8J6BT23_ZIZPA|nr:hypothetical protein GUJ93_ZPchr0012g21293 [Zizania palustris]